MLVSQLWSSSTWTLTIKWHNFPHSARARLELDDEEQGYRKFGGCPVVPLQCVMDSDKNIWQHMNRALPVKDKMNLIIIIYK